MAAVVLASLRTFSSVRSSRSSDFDIRIILDENNDGDVSSDEMKHNFKRLDVRADKMLERLTLEANIAAMLCKLPSFCVCMVCFMVAACEFVPTGAMRNVNRHIESHFGLDKVPEIKDYESIYEFIEAFEGKNKQLQATSTEYWCERRYAEIRWDDHLIAPVFECRSPRQYALSLTNDPRSSWSGAEGSAGGASSSGHRRLASSGGSSRSDGSGVPACEDDDARLQAEEANPNLTCASFAHHVCNIDFGILLCPRTCGFCGPFEYEQRKKFGTPQVTMLPTMVFQTRFRTDECHGFARIYEMQPFNPVLTLLPALDGRRHGRVLTCIDRKQQLDDKYAFELECPAGSPTTRCHNGALKVTEKHTYHGVPIYPKLLIEPHRDVEAMRRSEWLDLQTDTVTVSTVIYTEDSEIFSSLSVVFTVDEAGNVDGRAKLISYRDLTRGAKSRFIACLIVCALSAFFSVFLAALHHVREARDHKETKWGIPAFEILVNAAWGVYVIVLLVSWSMQVPMSVEYDHLLHSFLDIRSIEPEEVEHAIQVYFDTKTHMYEETNWLLRHRTAAVLVFYGQFIQIVLIFRGHPKVALLTSTVLKGASNITHFLGFFWLVFLLLGFQAHWMLGSDMLLFGTMAQTVRTQLRMCFAIFIEVDGAGDLNDVMKGMYWVYGVIFLFLVWITFMNFFVAILLDAFLKVKRENKEKMVVQDFPTDIYNVIRVALLRIRYRWPSNAQLRKYFRKAAAEVEAANSKPSLASKLRRADSEGPLLRIDPPDELEKLDEGRGVGEVLDTDNALKKGSVGGQEEMGNQAAEKHGTFFGLPLYPSFLIEPHRDFASMRAMDWLDLQTVHTREVTQSTAFCTARSGELPRSSTRDVASSYGFPDEQGRQELPRSSTRDVAFSGVFPEERGVQDEQLQDVLKSGAAAASSTDRPSRQKRKGQEAQTPDGFQFEDQPEDQLEGDSVGAMSSMGRAEERRRLSSERSEVLHVAVDKPGHIHPEDMLEEFKGQLTTESLAQLLCYYVRRAPKVLARRAYKKVLNAAPRQPMRQRSLCEEYPSLPEVWPEGECWPPPAQISI